MLKEMSLPTATYEGSPVEPVSGANLRRPSLRIDEAGGYLRMAEQLPR
jgi:hypothetical protein